MPDDEGKRSRSRERDRDLTKALQEALPDALKAALPTALSAVLEPIQREQERVSGELRTIHETLNKQKTGLEAAQAALSKFDTAIQYMMSNSHPLRAAEKAAMAATAHMTRISGFGGGVTEKTKADFLLDFCKQKFPALAVPTIRHTPYAVVLSFDHASDAAKFAVGFNEDKAKHQDKVLIARPELPIFVQESQRPLVHARHCLYQASSVEERKTIKVDWDKKIIYRQNTSIAMQDCKGALIVDDHIDATLKTHLLAAASSKTYFKDLKDPRGDGLPPAKFAAKGKGKEGKGRGGG